MADWLALSTPELESVILDLRQGVILEQYQARLLQATLDRLKAHNDAGSLLQQTETLLFQARRAIRDHERDLGVLELEWWYRG